MKGPTPNLDRLGLRSRVGKVPARSAFAPGTQRGAERPLLYQFVGSRTLTFSARALYQAGTPSIASGFSAWFGIASWRVPDDIGEQAALVGYRLELGPTAYNAAVTADPQVGTANAWGTSQGYGGALVIGTDLPAVVGSFTSGPANVPYVENPAASPTSTYGQANGATWNAFHFAPGNIGDAAPSIVYRTNQSTPLAVLLTGGSRLDVALVFRRSDAIAWAAGLVAVRVFGELTIASSLTRGEWVE